MVDIGRIFFAFEINGEDSHWNAVCNRYREEMSLFVFLSFLLFSLLSVRTNIEVYRFDNTYLPFI